FRLLWTRQAGHVAGTFARRPPIVVVIFDEMSTFTMLGPDGRIDRQRFPNFSALSDTSTWFPNAVSAFPYTMFAIPAIATGAAPDPGRGLLPTAGDYPDNLFTWLGGAYDLHVSEPITALCPPALCGASADANRRMLASDLVVLYLHSVMPRELAATRLPSLGYSWKGFGGPGAPQVTAAPQITAAQRAAFRADTVFNEAAEAGRPEMFRSFVAGVQRDDTPSLHFVHSLLPHDPYQHSASGRIYTQPALTSGVSKGNVWNKDPWIVDMGRRRHIEQERFVDKLLGELVAKLKEEDLFDRALVVVTSDHGGAFVPGEPHRTATSATYKELIATPLLIKLPRQQNAAVDPRPASGLDIVPTIAQVVGARVPWRVDGASLLADRAPIRPDTVYAGVSLPPLAAFDVRLEATHRTGTGPDERYERLVGQPVDSQHLEPAVHSIKVFSDAFRAFRRVAPAPALIPALVVGRLVSDTGEPVTFAIAVNGTIAAFARTLDWQGVRNYFAALVPEDLLRPGTNRLQFLRADITDDGRVRLAPISSDLTDGMSLSSTGGTTRLTTSGGAPILVSTAVAGTIERMDKQDKTVVLRGSVADMLSGQAPVSVMAFAGDQFIAATAPSDQRPDVAQALGVPAAATASFLLELSVDDLKAGPLRVFGLSDSAAGELSVSPQLVDRLARYR
ncbi:MAG TPA: sulfatase-like hydrolase/transferase, partial [Vicinamibacterales bacterium]|nr:sulfatase-like hydrolase/transferase [Vicinamibacterales bacterium]